MKVNAMYHLVYLLIKVLRIFPNRVFYNYTINILIVTAQNLSSYFLSLCTDITINNFLLITLTEV